MDRKVIGILVGCVAVLVIGVFIIGLVGSGLGSQLRARAEAVSKNFSETESLFAAARTEIEQAIAEQPTLFSADQAGRTWEERLDSTANTLAKAAPSTKKLETLLAENKADSQHLVEAEISTLSTARNRVLSEATEMRDTARKLIEFQNQVASKLPEMESDFAAIEKIDLTPVKTVIDKAVADWPAKKDDLQRRLTLYESARKNAASRWSATQEQRQRAHSGAATGTDIVELLQVATQLTDSRQSLGGAEAEITKLAEQLYWSWDKILVDMQIQEGELVSFRQKFQTTRNRTLILPEGKEDEAPEAPIEKDEPIWQTVDKRTYDSMKDHLGMSVQHKPAGKFDHEATSLVQPPGYAQMCPVSQQRNHYGYWRSYGPGYHWFYYRPYYPMQRHYWGSNYSPVSNTMYDSYDSHRRSGQTFYGSDNLGRPLYGSQGSVTKRQHAASEFVKSDGFKNTQYVKSGGTYKGSRFARAAAASTARRSSSYRSSSYSRSSGSRSSFGGK